MAIDFYQSITINIKGKPQPLFLDYMIKVTICRSYAMHENRSIITSEKLLKFAEKMIHIYNSDDIKPFQALRNGAPIIPKDILNQKLLLHKAKLMISFGKVKIAREQLLESINAGEKYDIRVRIETINQLLQLHKDKKSLQYLQLLKLLKSYNH